MRIRELDWAATPLGPIDAWPQSLRSALGICLGSEFPIAICWGADLRLLYNDTAARLLGSKHPWALGRAAREVWAEIWDEVNPLFERVLETGDPTYIEDRMLAMVRHGFTEEAYFNVAVSAVHGEEDQATGIFLAFFETTYRVVRERRGQVLRELARAITGAHSLDDVGQRAMYVFRDATPELPFAALYMMDPDGTARLLFLTGLPADHAMFPARLDPQAADLPWPFDKACATGSIEVVRGLRERYRLVAPPWPEPIEAAFVAPIQAKPSGQLWGVLVLGASPRRAIDEAYQHFVADVAEYLATAMSTASIYDEERRRADRLAEVDRTKTAFLSNISHEFRTPLTLLLGPIEDALTSGQMRGPDLETTHRSALRLLKLVNAILDFSRIESGRMAARFEPTDLATLTSDIASTFRAAIERAGLRLVVATSEAVGEIYVDRSMWENIVLNLISNAFKFTLQGEIRVELKTTPDQVELRVSDTGTGIPPDELENVFHRFHRIANPRARTQEGSGIGLALVQELVRLHGGTVRVDSEVGRGSTFVVTFPNEIRQVTAGPREAPDLARAHVEEVERWIVPPPDTPNAQILIADDNADMRTYLRRLLESKWTVAAVGDGKSAIEIAKRDQPDLVIIDVMMPEVDGFGVLAALRADERTHHTRVIMLSARGGEGARVEGLTAGADDYLSKPFSARELVARVRLQMTLASTRKQSEIELSELYSLLMQVPALISVWRGAEQRCVFQNTASLAMIDSRGKTLAEAWPDIPPARRKVFERVFELGETHVEREVEATRPWGGGAAETRYWDITFAPLRLNNEIEGVITIGYEVTEAVLSRRRAARAEAERATVQRRLHAALDASSIGTYFWDVRTGLVEYDEGVKELWGLPPSEGRDVEDYTRRIHPEDRPRWDAMLEQVAKEGIDCNLEYRVIRPDGTIRWVLDKGRMLHDDGKPDLLIGAVIDITESRQLAEQALAANRAKDEFLAMLGHELRNPLAPIMTAIELTKLHGEPLTKELQVVERQVHHLARLVDDLLDISRITRGQVTLQRERVPLHLATSRAIEIASPLLEQKRHQLTVDVDRRLDVIGDPVRLAQIFSNLLNNAARYTPPGGSIRLVARRGDGERAIIRVTDTGIGLSAEALDKIFAPFVQGTRGVARTEGGLGLGLALVRSLVQLHGGSVSAFSEGPGKGSEFVIELPLAPEYPEAARPHLAEPVRDIDRKRVLVVDDNFDAADMISEALRDIGHQVAVAHDGPEALRVADAFHPDVAVLDIGLPVMDGYELARRLGEMSGDHRPRLIALTGYGQPSDQERSKDAGFDVHMIKPVDVRALARAIMP